MQEKMFTEVVKILSDKGLILRKGNQWHFGCKAHIGVDKDTGLVHTIKATSANEHDVTLVSQLLHGEEKEVYGDSGYIGT